MNKIVFITRAFLTINICVVYCSLIFQPCLSNAISAESEHSEILVGVVENPYILNAFVPGPKNIPISTTPPNIMAKNLEIVEDLSPGRKVVTKQINKYNGNSAGYRASKTGKNNFWDYIQLLFYPAFIHLLFIHYHLRIDERRSNGRYRYLADIVTEFTCNYPKDINYKFHPNKGWTRS